MTGASWGGCSDDQPVFPRRSAPSLSFVLCEQWPVLQALLPRLRSLRPFRLPLSHAPTTTVSTSPCSLLFPHPPPLAHEAKSSGSGGAYLRLLPLLAAPRHISHSGREAGVSQVGQPRPAELGNPMIPFFLLLVFLFVLPMSLIFPGGPGRSHATAAGHQTCPANRAAPQRRMPPATLLSGVAPLWS